MPERQVTNACRRFGSVEPFSSLSFCCPTGVVTNACRRFGSVERIEEKVAFLIKCFGVTNACRRFGSVERCMIVEDNDHTIESPMPVGFLGQSNRERSPSAN